MDVPGLDGRRVERPGGGIAEGDESTPFSGVEVREFVVGELEGEILRVVVLDDVVISCEVLQCVL